jgi:outer membrane lipoprotein carrier protein
MKFFYRLKILFVCSLIPLQGLAATAASDQLVNVLNRLQSIRANFIQTVMDGRGQILQKTTGQMTLQRPGRFRWQVEQPNRQLLIADGQRIWFYDVDLQQVVIQKQQVVDVNSPAALLSDAPKNLTKHFNIAFLENMQSFYLLPKDKSALFRSIILVFQQDRLYEMRLADKLGQQTVINFSQVELNPAVSPQIFHFVLPSDKNIEIVKG